ADDARGALRGGDRVGVGDGPAAGAADLLDHIEGGATRGRAAVEGDAVVVHDHLRALGGEPEGDAPADAAARASDDRDAAGEHVCHECDLPRIPRRRMLHRARGGALFGYLADRHGRRAVLQWSILTYSAGTVLCGIAPGVATLLAARLVTGLGVGGEWAIGHALLGESVPARLRGRFGALLQTGAPVGVGLAALVGSFVAPRIGWRATFILSGLPALLVTAIRRP